MNDRNRRRLVAGLELLLALLLALGVWVALPARWLPIDAAGSLLAALLAAGAVALLVRPGLGRPLSMIAGWAALLVGSALITALALAAAHLSGLYGPVGAGGALLLAAVAALLVPYLVGLPVLQLILLRKPK